MIHAFVAPLGMLACTLHHEGVARARQRRTHVTQSVIVHLAIEVNEIAVHGITLLVEDTHTAVATITEGVPYSTKRAPFRSALKFTLMASPPSSVTGCNVSGFHMGQYSGMLTRKPSICMGNHT